MATNDPRWRARCHDCNAMLCASELLNHVCEKQAARVAQVRDRDRRAVSGFLLVFGIAAFALWVVIKILGWIAEVLEGTR